MNKPEKNFEKFCNRRKWKFYKISELSGLQTPDYFVVINDLVFICEVKNLCKSGVEREDIVEFKDKKDNIVGVCLDYNKEVDSIVNKIDEARPQFRTTSSFKLPNVLVIYSERFRPIDKNMIFQAVYGKSFPVAKFNKDKGKFIFKKEYTKFLDISCRKNKNNLISAVAITNKQDGMFVLHNLWANISLPFFLFNKKDDINYIPEEITFKEIKGN